MTTDYVVWVVGMLKGGIRKTTTTFYLAWALAQLGENVLVIDADAGTQGISEWATRLYQRTGQATPFNVRGWAYGMAPLVEFVDQQAAECGATHVLIDMGAEYPQILFQAALIADRVISPCGVDNAEIARLGPTRSKVVEADGSSINVLLTCVPRVGIGKAAAVRAALEKEGYHVFGTEVPENGGLYADTFGWPIEDLGAYRDLVVELTEMGVRA